MSIRVLVLTSLLMLTSVFALRRKGLHTTYISGINRIRRLRMTEESFDETKSSHNYFVTTPIYYVNGLPHLGHAYTTVAADVLARFNRKDGKNVFFLTGTDEHGQKVQQSAEINGKTPIQFADEVSGVFRKLSLDLNCSNDYFIRTTEPKHIRAVQAFWKDLEAKGHIYKGSYEGWYSIRDESFYAESELIDGKAPTGAQVEWVKEESYFFRLSAWTDKLLAFYEAHPNFIGPDGRRNEVISFVSQDGGLKDLSISRTTFSWGIPVPGNEQHVVYVWMDALTNYLSALGYPFEDSSAASALWPASLHLVGKDILRFHAVFWPAFLMAAGLQPPKRIFAHGWWTRDGEKMSKSVGNVLDPFELLKKYGVDYLRYFMVSHIPFGNDGDFTDDAFITRINSNLANDFGNLAQRALSLVVKQCDGLVPEPGPFTEDDNLVFSSADAALDLMRSHANTQNLHKMSEVAIQLASLGNKYIDTQAPWALKKTDPDRMRTVLYVLVELIRRIAILLEPIMPSSCDALMTMMNLPPEMRTFGSYHLRIPPGHTVNAPYPIFPKIETAESLLKKKARL